MTSDRAEDPLELAARRLATAPDDLTADQWLVLLHLADRYLSSRFPALVRVGDADDVAAAALESLLLAARQGRISVSRNPSFYVITTVHNAALDRIRVRNRRTSHESAVGGATELAVRQTEHDPSPDDVVAARLDRHATAERVRDALARARDAGDGTAFRVVTTILDEIQETGDVPSNRQVAATLGLSHTGVAKALRRFCGDYLPGGG